MRNFGISGCYHAFTDRSEPEYPVDRNRSEDEPDPVRVRAFEGLSLQDFERTLPHLRGREQALQELGRIVGYDVRDGANSPTRIDPLWETMRAARLFRSQARDAYPHLWPLRVTERDIRAYEQAAQIRYWESHRGDVYQEYRLSEAAHPFARLAEALPVEQLPALRGLPGFYALAGNLMQVLPHVAQTRSLTVLYPGSGFHVAPLVTALKLIDEGTIDEASFIYTEISLANLSVLESILRRGVGIIFDSLTLEASRTFPGEGSEQEITIHYKGRPVRILFALNRSGGEYYRPEYLNAADLIVLHDPGQGSLQDSFNLLARIVIDKQALVPTKPQAVIMEGTRGEHPDDRFGFPPGLPQTLLPGPYGHCGAGFSFGELEYCQFDHARAFPLNDPALLSLAAQHPSAWELSGILFPRDQEMIFYQVAPPR